MVLTTGKGVSAKVVGDRDATDRVSVAVQGRMLVVRANRSSWGGWPSKESAAATVLVSTPMVQAAYLIGSGSLSIDKMKGPRIALAVEGSGRLRVAAVTTDRLDVTVSGSGRAEVAGITKDGSAIVRGAGELDASKLAVSDLVLTSDSAGAVTATARRSAKVTASGAGTVEVTGPAACTVRQLGSGPVKCGK